MHNGEKGFTLIELLVVMMIIATLMSLVVPRYFQQTQRAKEVVLKHNLATLRSSLDSFQRDHLVAPSTLDELVTKQYLRTIPLDPVTNRKDSWVINENEEGGIADVHSGSGGRSLEGTPYADW